MLIWDVARGRRGDWHQLYGPPGHRDFNRIAIAHFDSFGSARHEDNAVTRAQRELSSSLAQHKIDRDGRARLDFQSGFGWGRHLRPGQNRIGSCVRLRRRLIGSSR
jgi:hypothetical protein